MLKNPKQKLKFSGKMKICGQKSKIDISKTLAETRKNRYFDQKSNFCSKIKLLFKNQTFGQKPKDFSKIQIFIKNPNFPLKNKFGKRKFSILI